ncbi:putative PAP-specific phosphatase, mitochondrial [Papaver somniferum]|uniref:putative PAP-specific phosphatase, mitochondrial n=1 Tax=Papaver somniferum TaxID=3469 RepID=UPI000E6FF0E8|nr:putative PAP-specific phosphatase, mitochondrial [Papaver somniferum]
MDILRSSSSQFSLLRFTKPNYSSPFRKSSHILTLSVRSSSFPQKGKYHRELQAAVDVVEKACRLCVDVKKSLLSSDERILEKNDQTPVTVADFGVQALISLELGRLFPSIPLVAEEDSSFLTSNSVVDSIVNTVIDKADSTEKPLTRDVVLQAIDRGGKDGFTFGDKPATYWVLDPIDGTRGFLKGSEALYVVGLALVVEGEVTLGVMGCPNWQEDSSSKTANQDQTDKSGLPSGSGTIMASHVGCGTWMKSLSNILGSVVGAQSSWSRCYVEKSCLVHEARFCISESQTWESLPLSTLYTATTNSDNLGDKQVLLVPTCCGSLCKYLMVASGRASVFIYQAKAEKPVKSWDHAVGIICVNEAGGQVTDWTGRKLDLAADRIERRLIFPSGGVLITNGNVHNEILEVISSVLPVI